MNARRILYPALAVLAAPAPAEPSAPSGRAGNAGEASAPVCARPVAEASTVGGQAVMEGVMMRNGSVYALALRTPDGDIVAERRRWYSLATGAASGKPFVRGFPLLVETLVNGVKALNRSAEFAAPDESDKPGDAPLALTLVVSLALAAGLFVAAPHLLALGMKALGLGGDLERLSFHLWDGFFKFTIFLSYIAAISLVPDIRRVFQYHGAEHKVIRAFEKGGEVSARTAAACSRLHPRCGTTFMLFVLSVAIVLHAVLVPFFLWLWQPQGAFARHAGTLVFKLLLMVPISAVAYEIIRYAARLGSSPWGRLVRGPGLLLQLLTTREPAREHLDVALVALREALSPEAAARLQTPAYTVLE